MFNKIPVNKFENEINNKDSFKIYRAKMKVVIAHIFLSNLLLFIWLFIIGGLSGFVLIVIIYLLAFGVLYLGVFIGYLILKINLKIIYPITFVISIMMLPIILSWLNGNSISDSIEGVFFNR